MKWERTSKYSQTCGPWTVTACKVEGELIYTLWHGSQRVDTFDTPQEAKRRAERPQNATAA